MKTAIRIHADPTCPWCYLNVSYFEWARADFEADIFHIETAPYLINPDLPVNGMDFQTYLMARFGDHNAVAEALLPLQKGAEKENIPLHLERIKIMPNTLKAQTLLYWARQTGLDYPLFRLMQNAHFVEGIDLSDDIALSALAREIGMDKSIINTILNEGKATLETQNEIKTYAEQGITEVPTIVIGKTYVVTGVQSVSFWRNVISEIDEKGRELARTQLD